jgi:hypothetical protein
LSLKIGVESPVSVLQVRWYEELWELEALLYIKDILEDNTVCAIGCYNIPSAQQFLLEVPDILDTPLLFHNY